jgi:hypothetical protein
MTIEIIPVKSKRELKEFVKFPFTLYRNSKFWVPPLIKDELSILDPSKNPAMDHSESVLYVAKENGRIVGRIAGIINHLEVEKMGLRQVRFGWFDFIDDVNVSGALLSTIEKWGRDKGMTQMQGPMGFTNLDKAAFLIEGFDELPTVATIYNYSYYKEHLEELGYEKAVDYVEYEFAVPDPVPAKVQRFAKLIQEKYKLRIIIEPNKKKFQGYAKQLFALINQTHQALHGFIPFSERQINLYVEKYSKLINPEFVTLIVNDEDRLIGYAISMPSYSRAFQKAKGRIFPFGIFHLLKAAKRPKTMDLMLIGIADEYRNKGIIAMIFNDFITKYLQHGIIKAESNPELENNQNVKAMWKNYENRQHKRRRTFIKKLQVR